MTRTSRAGPALAAGYMQFEVRDGIRRITCSISEEALEAASGLAVPSTIALRRRSFDRFRTLIDAAAKLKLKTLPPGFSGAVTLTSRDLRSVPPELGVPSYGTSPRGS
jgi:Protein of unknown function (DUF1488)